MPTPAPIAEKKGSAVDRLDPWKEDGNIVLAAEGKYFRVHRSILGAQSEVFKDMFECIRSNEAEKGFIEMCPVIHLHDTATDVQMVLKALYNRSYPMPYYEKMPISVVAAFLRLGEKYAIPVLVEEAKARLCCALEPELSITTLLALPYSSRLFPGISDGDPHNFQIMNLLQEMDMKAPLPLAMYQCAITCPLSIIADGHQSDGSVCSLSLPNLRSFIRTKDVLETFRVWLAKNLSTSPSCIQTRCTHNIRRLWPEDIAIVPPFYSWRTEWDKMFCESCKNHLEAKRETGMNRVWQKLPAAFGFSSWVEVRKSGDFPWLTIRT